MKEKKLHLELLRFLAILLVIFNHTGDKGYLYFTTQTASSLYPLYFTASVLCKVAVPLFWMVSGALLLDKDEDIRTIFRKRVLRIFLVLLVFSFGYYLYSAKGKADYRFSPVYFVKLFYSSDLAPAFWYLYAYLGMLIILPVLRKAAKHMTNREFMYFFLAMLFIRGILPVLEYALWHGEVSINSSFAANFFSYDVVFFLMGYFLEKRIEDSLLNWRGAAALLVFGAAAIAMMMIATQLKLNDGGLMTDGDAEKFYAGLLFVPSAALYYTLRLAFRNADAGRPWAKLICALGSVSFGVMLLEHFIRCETVFVHEALCKVLPCFTSSLIWTLFIYLIGGIVIYLLKKIPFVRKYI